MEVLEGVEQVTVFDKTGAAVGTHIIVLDEAYRASSVTPLKYDMASGPTRIAVVDPWTGGIAKVLSAEVPTEPRCVADYNLAGKIAPARASVTDQLVVTGPSVSMVPVYSLQ